MALLIFEIFEWIAEFVKCLCLLHHLSPFVSYYLLLPLWSKRQYYFWFSSLFMWSEWPVVDSFAFINAFSSSVACCSVQFFHLPSMGVALCQISSTRLSISSYVCSIASFSPSLTPSSSTRAEEVQVAANNEAAKRREDSLGSHRHSPPTPTHWTSYLLRQLTNSTTSTKNKHSGRHWQPPAVVPPLLLLWPWIQSTSLCCYIVPRSSRLYCVTERPRSWLSHSRSSTRG